MEIILLPSNIDHWPVYFRPEVLIHLCCLTEANLFWNTVRSIPPSWYWVKHVHNSAKPEEKYFENPTPIPLLLMPWTPVSQSLQGSCYLFYSIISSSSSIYSMRIDCNYQRSLAGWKQICFRDSPTQISTQWVFAFHINLTPICEIQTYSCHWGPLGDCIELKHLSVCDI